jgi:antitoxin component YwqK of YwqJK toxin-antitoxin module
MDMNKVRTGLFYIIILCIPVALAAQDIPADTIWNQTDANGYKQGHWRKYYESGVLRYKGYFFNNRPVGQFTRYYESRGKMADVNYSIDGITSFARLFYQNGYLAAEGKFIYQEKDSIWKYYSYYSNSLAYEETYSKGIKHGLSKVYYENGQVAQTTMWDNNRKHGPWQQFYEDSSVRMVTQYDHDKLDGKYQVFNSDGIIIIDGTYDQDQKIGTWSYYMDDGSEDFILVYVNGVLQNEEVMQQKLEEFMEEVEKNLGTIPEPDLENFIPQ